MFLFGPLETGEFRVFLILLDPGCPGDPKVGFHGDCVVSSDTVGGIQALGCLEGPPQTGFGVAKKRPARRRACLVGHFGLVRVKFAKKIDFATSRVPRGPQGSVP